MWWCLGIFFSVLYDAINLMQNILKGKPDMDGVYLLGLNADIKENLYQDITSKQYKGRSYAILGEGKGVIPCELHKIQTNNIYIYSYSVENSSFQICRPVAYNKNEFDVIADSVDIPFYIKWQGYDKLHFELFGNYFNFSNQEIQNKMSNLPIGSTFIITAAVDHVGIRRVSDELISLTHTTSLYENNPYFRFLKYLINNPDNNFIFVKLASETKIFSTNINELVDFSNASIIAWQQTHMKNFIDFYFNISNFINYRNEQEFQSFIKNNLVDSNKKEEFAASIITAQDQNITKYKELLLFNLISKGLPEKITDILNTGTNVNSLIKGGITPLHIATALGKEDVVKLLINNDAKVESSTTTKLTPLMEASKKGFVSIANVLLDNGANSNAQDIDGNTPLILAIYFQKHGIVELLLNQEADLNHVNQKKENALTYAMKGGDLSIIKLLLSYAPDLKSLEYTKCSRDYEISNDIKNEIEKFEVDPINYVLQNHHNILQANKALDNLKSYTNSEEYIDYINLVQVHLQDNFASDKSYHNLLEIFSYSYSLEHIVERLGDCLIADVSIT